jgi:hypothetical protein
MTYCQILKRKDYGNPICRIMENQNGGAYL